MKHSNHSAARVLLPTPPVLPKPGNALDAAREVLKLLVHVRFVTRDAQMFADDGHLSDLAQRLRERIKHLDDELLPEISSTVKMLEAAANDAARKAVKP